MNISKTIRTWLSIPNEEEERQTALQLQEESVKDFERVIITLSSAVHEAHIETAENMFVAFKNKWSALPRTIIEYNDVIFNRERQKIMDRLLAVDIAYNMSKLYSNMLEEKRVQLLLN